MNYSGQCFCGAVTYIVEEEPLNTINCHCRDCQRWAGGAYLPELIFRKTNFNINGKVKFYTYLSEQGHKVHRGFCPHCGGSVYATNDKMKDIVIVYAGTLDNPQQYNPKFDIYTRSAPAWSPMLTTTTQFETWPEFKGC